MNRVVNSLGADGGTDMTGALQAASSALYYSNNDKAVIVVTDGYPNSPESAISVANDLKRRGILIAAIGVGSGVSEYFIRQIATASHAYHINNMSELQSAFKTAINNIMERR